MREFTTADSLPELEGEPVRAGPVVGAPMTIAFLAAPTASNQSCR